MGKKTEYLDAYIRVSTASQKKDGNSLVVQQRLAESVAKKLGMELRIHSEGARSSTTQYRDELAQIKDGIRDKTIKNIWVQDRSRIFRDDLESLLFRKQWAAPYNVVLYEGELPHEINFKNMTPHEELIYDIISKVQDVENK